MSFKCEICNEAQATGTKVIPVVTARRPQEYENEVIREDNNGRDKRIQIESSGLEIVKEKRSCASCVEKQLELEVSETEE